MATIPFNRATLGAPELNYIRQATMSGRIAGDGPSTKIAETYIEGVTGSRSLLTTSCTHALEMAAILLDLEPGDEVIVPSFTFVSSALAFAMHGAKIVFSDVDTETLSAGPQQIEPLITSKTKAVCAVHYGGIANKIEQLARLCEDRGIVLIEDNAHGFLATHNGRILGTFGSLATQSFHETKNIVCGEGGALLVNDERFAERAEILREKGTDRSKFLRGAIDKYSWVDKGSSYVLSDLLAGILLGQLQRFDDIQDRRRAAYFRYMDELSDWANGNGVTLPPIRPKEGHAAHVFYVRLPRPELQVPLIEHLDSREIKAVFHYQPLHLSVAGAKYGKTPLPCPVTEEAAGSLVRLPLFETLSVDDQSRIIESVTQFKL